MGFQSSYDINGFRPLCTVGVDLRTDNRSLLIQIESARHGQGPGVVTVESLEVEGFEREAGDVYDEQIVSWTTDEERGERS